VVGEGEGQRRPPSFGGRLRTAEWLCTQLWSVQGSRAVVQVVVVRVVDDTGQCEDSLAWPRCSRWPSLPSKSPRPRAAETRAGKKNTDAPTAGSNRLPRVGAQQRQQRQQRAQDAKPPRAAGSGRRAGRVEGLAAGARVRDEGSRAMAMVVRRRRAVGSGRARDEDGKA